jgi:hypothetical protein
VWKYDHLAKSWWKTSSSEKYIEIFRAPTTPKLYDQGVEEVYDQDLEEDLVLDHRRLIIIRPDGLMEIQVVKRSQER